MTTSNASASRNRDVCRFALVVNYTCDPVSRSIVPSSSSANKKTGTDGQEPVVSAKCPRTEQFDAVWPETSAGATAVVKCPEAGDKRWQCSDAGSWASSGPDTSDCRSLVIQQLAAATNSPNEVKQLEILQQTAEVTSNITLQPGDLSLLVSTIESIGVATNKADLQRETDESVSASSADSSINQPESDSKIRFNAVVQTTSNLLDTKQRDAWQKQPNRTDLVCRMIDSVESVAFAYARQLDRKPSSPAQSSSPMSGNSGSESSSAFHLPPQSPSVTQSAAVVAQPSVEVQVHVVSLRNQDLDADKPPQSVVVDGSATASASASASMATSEARQEVASLPVRVDVSAYVDKFLDDEEPTELAVVFARYRNVADYVDATSTKAPSPDEATARMADLAGANTEQQKTSKPNRIKSASLISDIISASVKRLDVDADTVPRGRSYPASAFEDNDRRAVVEFTLTHTTTNLTGERICVFWYPAHDGESAGYWSDAGCWRVTDAGDEQETNRTRCACSHLTNFAVLLDTSGVLRGESLSDENEVALTLLTLIGSGLSCICALFAFILFSITKVYKGRFPERNTIHKNVSINLCVAQLLLLVNIIAHSTLDVVACTVLGVLQHLFFLITFSWISLEGVQLFIMLVIVFETKRSLRPIFYSIGYGVPALIVIVSVAVRSGGYVNRKMCWLTPDEGFIWAFAGPVALVLAINYTVYVVAWITIGRHSARRAQRSDSNRACIADEQASSSHHSPSNASSSPPVTTTRAGIGSSQLTSSEIRSWLKGASVLCVLLGLTWVFGFLLWIGPTSAVVFAYLFTVFNSLQGTLIFVLHFLVDSKVRTDAWNQVQRSRVMRWISRASSRSSRSSSLKPPCVASPPNRNSSSARLGLFKSRKSNTNSSSSHNFNSVLSLFGRRIALRRGRKAARSDNEVSSDAKKSGCGTAKEKLLAGEIIIDPERLEAKVREQRCADSSCKIHGSDVGYEQHNCKFLHRILAEAEDFSVTSVADPCSYVTSSQNSAESDSRNSNQLSSSVSRNSSSISPFATQYPPSYAQATCYRCAAGTLMHTDSAYNTQSGSNVTDSRSKRKSECEPVSQFESDALSSYCDSRILTEFADTNSGDHRRHHHKCGCDRAASFTSSNSANERRHKPTRLVDRSDSLDDKGRSGADSETDEDLAMWRDGLADSVSNVNDSDATTRVLFAPAPVGGKAGSKRERERERDRANLHNYDKNTQSRLSALLTVVAEKDFESDVSDGELFNLTATPHTVVDCRENDAFERSNSNSVGDDAHSAAHD